MNNRKNIVILAVGLGVMAMAAGTLGWLKSRQRLGEPGVKSTPIAGEASKVNIPLPEVYGYKSEVIPPEALVTNILLGASLSQKRYTARDKFWVNLNVVLMGTDRTDLHKPQFCLVGAGWKIDKTEVVTVPMTQPHPYELPVIRLTASRNWVHEGKTVPLRGIYCYWFVDDDSISADPGGFSRMWSMTRSLVTRGVLERWAYITAFAICEPGQEDATFARMKEFMAEAVPQFQRVPKPANETAAASKP